MKEKLVTLPLKEYNDLTEFNENIRKNNCMTISIRGGSVSFGSGYGYNTFSPSYEQIDYFTTDETVKKLGEINADLKERLESVDKLEQEIGILKREIIDLKVIIYDLEATPAFWRKLIGAFKNRK